MAYNRIAGIGKLTISNGTATNPTVLQTMDNIICFTSEITGVTRNAAQAFAQLPAAIAKPNVLTHFTAVVKTGTTYTVESFYITASGYIACRHALSNATVYLNGCCVNFNDKFYNDTIGNNNQSNMTYPIGRL